MTERSDVPWAAATGVVGIVGIAVIGLSWIGVGAKDLVLLLPLAVLIAGLAWSVGLFDPQQAAGASATPPTQTERSSIAPAVLPNDALMEDAPTVTVRPVEPAEPQEPEGVSEAVRQAAAATFDLDALLVDETPDRVQCANCGRYNALDAPERGTIRCRMCGASRRLTAIQPDTRVRMFIDDDHTRQVPVVTLATAEDAAPGPVTSGLTGDDRTPWSTTPVTGSKGD